MTPKRTLPGRKATPRAKRGAGAAKTRGPAVAGRFEDRLTFLAKTGDKDAFLSLVRFHSTFNPLPITRDVLLLAGLDEVTRRRLLGRLQRKEDNVLRPFPGVDMIFWGEPWVQEALDRYLWKTRGPKAVPDEDFVAELWNATREGALLQLRIYKKAKVTPSAWVQVKYPHFANLGLSDAEMLKVARAEGCTFDEGAFHRAVRRFRRGA